MNKTKTKIISFLMVAFVVFIPFVQQTFFAYSVHEDVNINKIVFHDTENDFKILSANQLKIKVMEFNERLTKESYIMIQFDSDYQESEEYKELLKKRDSIETEQDKNTFRESVKTVSKSYHKKIVEEKLKNLDLPAGVNVEHIDYSPFVKISVNNTIVDSAAITRLADNNDVKSLDIALREPIPITDDYMCSDNETTLVPENAQTPDDEMSFNTALGVIGASSVVNNSMYTGKGVKVGLYESGGVPNINHVNLQGKNVIIRDSSQPYTDHATSVASLIFSLAPDVTMYASNVNVYGVGWFIDNHVDVVNCSFGYYNNTLNPDGTYTNGDKVYRHDIDGVYDYQIQTNFIQVVTSAGNYNNNNTSSSYNPDNRVTSPGHAKNVVTVGGTKRSFKFNCNVFGYVNEHEPNASYTTVEAVSKPNISAPFTIEIPNIGIRQGTSFAAPQVTGVMALCLELKRFYMWPESMHAIISTTASEIYDQSRDYANFDNRVGAGIINLDNMLNVRAALSGQVFYTDEYRREVFSMTLQLTKNQELRSTLFWIVRYESTTLYCTDYDLYLYDANDNMVAQCSTGGNNAERIVYKVSSTGSYRLVVYQFGVFQGTAGIDYFCLSYMY